MEKKKIKCRICNKNFNALISHLRSSHNIKTSKEYYDKYIKKPNEGKCLVCGKKTAFLSIKLGYQPYCSIQCSGKSELHRKHIERTTFKHFHVKNVSQAEPIKRKKDRTNLKRRGVKNPFQDSKVKRKIKKYWIDNYGVEYNSQVPEIRRKAEDSFEKKHGVRFPMQDEKVKRKREKTCEKLFKNKNFIVSKKGKESSRKTKIKNKKLGFDSTSERIFFKLFKNSFQYTLINKYTYNGKVFDFALVKGNKLKCLIDLDGEIHKVYSENRLSIHDRYRISEDKKLIIIDISKWQIKNFSKYIIKDSYDFILKAINNFLKSSRTNKFISLK